MLTVYLFSKVFVVCDQDPIFRKGFLNDYIVIYSPRGFIYRKDFMSLSTEPFGYFWSSGFVHKKTHLRILRR
ncbi:MAG: hypothetical protein CNIPEHKO_00240 [Anaerolineales bacterium]|nr:hypothetical protein [Anaerolineales bacterium]